MLDTEELDMVSVCTYTVDPEGHDLHTEITLYCIEKGIPAVWCEKPAVADMTGGDAMLAAAKANGTLLAINHNRRWENVQRKLQAAVAEGQLGNLTSANIIWPSGRMGVVGTHFIDNFLMVCGQRCVSVSGMVDESPHQDCRNNPDDEAFMAIQGETNVEDPGCFATLKMDGGLVASVCAGNSLSGGASITLFGTMANATISGSTIEVTFFGEVSSTGQIVGEPRTEVWEEDESDGLNTCERCVREMVATLDGTAPFPCTSIAAAALLRSRFESNCRVACRRRRHGRGRRRLACVRDPARGDGIPQEGRRLCRPADGPRGPRGRGPVGLRAVFRLRVHV